MSESVEAAKCVVGGLSLVGISSKIEMTGKLLNAYSQAKNYQSAAKEIDSLFLFIEKTTKEYNETIAKVIADEALDPKNRGKLNG